MMANLLTQKLRTPPDDICQQRFSLFSFAFLLGTLACTELFSSRSISSKLKSYLTVQDVPAIRRDNSTTSWDGDGWEQSGISASFVKSSSNELDRAMLYHEELGGDKENVVYDNDNGHDSNMP
mmetsp:Transcript_16158/g.33587  ORF Transcript_16158/g.33587 Transcript_16158/m.33587 type:complete len:123 (-) Transcript_16158:16-384(-)